MHLGIELVVVQFTTALRVVIVNLGNIKRQDALHLHLRTAPVINVLMLVEVLRLLVHGLNALIV